MTRAEEAAYDAYPKKSAVSGVSMIGNNDRDDFKFQRDIFRRGYEQAEKDLALTWQDIRRIVKIADAELGRHTQDELAEMGEEKYYETILEKYNQPR